MAKELLVVGIDRILWPKSLGESTLQVMKEFGWVGKGEKPKVSTGVTKTIGQALRGRTVASANIVARQVAQRFAQGIDHDALDRLRSEFPSKDYRHVAMSTAPSFVVRRALERLREEEGVWFFDALASEFRVQEGKYTGECDILYKQKAVASLLERTGMPNVAVGLINGMSDLKWARSFCARIELVNPGERLKYEPILPYPKVPQGN